MSKSTKVKRVAVYVRVSTHDQADANTEENQIDKIKQYVEMRDELEFAGEKHRYVDKAVSGTIDIYERPEMRRLFEDAR
jgi:DNA invertase Pin-like site-specific DNA recombinase